MTFIIAGSRTLGYIDLLYAICEVKEEITGVISGKCPTGIDKAGEQLWEQYIRSDYPNSFYPFPAEWKKYGKKAGYLRNTQMAIFAKSIGAGLIAVWDGESNGTKHMIQTAKDNKLEPIYTYIWDPSQKFFTPSS